jgi:hypothetical protein
MLTAKRFGGLGLSSALCVFVLAGCGLPTPAVHAQLHVSESGGYELDAVPVPAQALAEVLRARHAQVPTLQVQVRASPRADIAAVRWAVQAAQQAQVRLAFADELAVSAAVPAPARGPAINAP